MAAAVWAAFSLFDTQAADWPQWRFDAQHSANSPEQLPPKLAPAWTREYSPRVAAWEDALNQDLMPLDRVFEPIVLGDKLILGFNDRDKLVALDTRTGQERWTFFADAPIRLAPAAANGKIFFTSDDGHCYALNAQDGKLLWKFRGGPSDRKALANGRLASAWPARGGVVVRDNTVYFAASIWPFMGTFIYALEAETGKLTWVNDGTSATYMKQPHNAPAFAGVAPQGTLVATEKVLLTPGGRSIPAGFDRATGRFLYFNLAESGKGVGGSEVMANDTEFFVHTRLSGTRGHDLKNGKASKFALDNPVFAGQQYFASANYAAEAAALVEAETKLEAAQYAETRAGTEMNAALNLAEAAAILKASNALASASAKLKTAQAAVAKAKPATPPANVVQAWQADKSLAWELKADASGDLIRAGKQLYAGGSNTLAAINLPEAQGAPTVAWQLPVPGQVRRLLAANGMLFAVTLEGRVLAFGAAAGDGKIIREDFKVPSPAPAALERAKAILAQTKADEGYALCLGLDDHGDLLAALAAASKLQLIGVDADAAKIDRLRRQFDAAGLYGKRIALLAADPSNFGAPPYLANLIVADGAFAAQLADAAVLRRVYESVRPYGGSLYIASADAAKIKAAQLPKAVLAAASNAVLVTREGALPGSADWTHQYGDAGNSVKSDDKLVKLPLGLLWFGGNGNADVLPRHGHGPTEQIAGGRLFIEGVGALSARDVYTGRPLWKTAIPELNTAGMYYNDTMLKDPLTTLYSQIHIPGANARGANYVATEDRLYLAVSNQCLVLDTASGKILQTIQMPAAPSQPAPQWAYIAVCDDVLLGGAGFGEFNKKFGLKITWPPSPVDQSASSGLVAFDRHTVKVLWRADARHGFIHNGIAAGKGRVFCLDRLPKSAEAKAKKKTGQDPEGYRVVAFDLHTGKIAWEQTKDVFGSWLSYSKEHDVLLQAGATAVDRLKDEVNQGLMVLRAADGSVAWYKPDLKYTGPCILYHDLVITTPTSYHFSSGAYYLKDGAPHNIVNPLTGASQPWRVYRTYGCNTPVAAENLMTFRSGAAGFYDLETHGGAGNLGGFKSGCSINLIAANGVLNAPDYTRTCSCAYQNQTSLGLVHMPEMETWTCNFSAIETKGGERVQRVGINLGAPGNRLADGSLWLEYPPAAGISPRVPITVEPANAPVFRHHSGRVAGNGPAWVFASGLRDVSSLTIRPQLLKPELPEAVADEETPAEAPAAGADTTPKDTPLPDLPEAKYTVRLYFLEPDAATPGQRVFDVALQDKTVVTAFDIAKETSAPNRGLIKEFKNVAIKNDLKINLRKAASATLGPVLSGVELVLEKN